MASEANCVHQAKQLTNHSFKKKEEMKTSSSLNPVVTNNHSDYVEEQSGDEYEIAIKSDKKVIKFNSNKTTTLTGFTNHGFDSFEKFNPVVSSHIKLNQFSSDFQLNSEEDNSKILIQWKDLDYKVTENSRWRQWILRKEALPWKRILEEQSGKLAGGTLTALMGPSGAGKTTLLNCITGNCASGGLCGSISVCSPKAKITIGTVPQHDDVFPMFTVKETLMFASKMKNAPSSDHETIVGKVILGLNLKQEAKNLISQCSGGQRKRVSIGTELVSNPDILVLDEPTTGLDSDTSDLIVALIRDLAQSKQMAIVATIHQPSNDMFNYFHQVYMLAKGGRCMFFGPPNELIETIQATGVMCPLTSNPSDFAIEVASGKYGDNAIDMLVSQLRQREHLPLTSSRQLNDVISNKNSNGVSFVRQVALITSRSFVQTNLRSLVLPFQLFVALFVAIQLGILFGEISGKENGCWSLDQPELYLDKVTQRERFTAKKTIIEGNATLIYFHSLFAAMIYSIGTVLTFPTERPIIVRELKNKWYSPLVYVIGTSLSLMPGLLLASASFFFVLCHLSEQQLPDWRLMTMFAFYFSIVNVAQAWGNLFGAWFYKDQLACIYNLFVATTPFFFTSGYFITRRDSPWYMAPFFYVSLVRPSFSGMLATCYGFGRCKRATSGGRVVNFFEESIKANNPLEIIKEKFDQNSDRPDFQASFIAASLGVEDDIFDSIVKASEKFIDDEATLDPLQERALMQPSYVLDHFDIVDDSLWQYFAMLFAFYLIIKAGVYLGMKKAIK